MVVIVLFQTQSTVKASTVPSAISSWQLLRYPFSSSSSPLSSSSEDYPQRILKATKQIDKAMKRAKYDQECFYQSMAQQITTANKKDENEDYVFEFPITPDKMIYARLELDVKEYHPTSDRDTPSLI